MNMKPSTRWLGLLNPIAPSTSRLARSPTRTHLPTHLSWRHGQRPRPTLPFASRLSSLAPGSQHHDTLESFLTHASQTNLSQTSSTFVGTRYEYICSEALNRLGFHLTRTGRSNDAGIDLVGDWRVPTLPPEIPLKILVQCKVVGWKSPKGKAKLADADPSVTGVPRSEPIGRARWVSPEHIREIEGAFAGAPAGWRGDNTIAILATTSPTTKGVREALQRSSRPLAFAMITEDGSIQQLVWNARASTAGLEGLDVGMRYKPDAADIGGEVVLMYQGKVVRSKRRRSRKQPGRVQV